MRQIMSETCARITRRNALALMLGATIELGYSIADPAEAATAAQINHNVNTALAQLRASSPKAKMLLPKAVGVLVFPKIIKGGFIVGGQYGEGALRVGGKTVGYYNIAAASFGLQAGGQAFSYALLFMNQAALDYLRKSDGWAVGSGPSIVVVDKGAAASATSTTLTEDVVAFPFGQHGLMAGLGIEGSKITPITPGK
ncbi:MAG TPA: YSC84-related protein [Stellaceae bacterium]|nr:YSC84-related protein [Stellaceae bacterium]